MNIKIFIDLRKCRSLKNHVVRTINEWMRIQAMLSYNTDNLMNANNLVSSSTFHTILKYLS